MSSHRGFLLRAQFYLVICGALYVALVGLLTIPFFQSQLSISIFVSEATYLTTILSASTLYLNAVRIPWFADFNVPEKYGLARELLQVYRAPQV